MIENRKAEFYCPLGRIVRLNLTVRLKIMTTYMSVFRGVRKYEHNGVFCSFSKYVKIRPDVFYYCRVHLSVE